MHGFTDAQSIFTVFFAIFWGASANVQPRWKPFPWTLVFRVPAARHRAITALILYNVLPILYFAWVISALSRATSTPSRVADFLLITALGVVPALGYFGIYRFWLALLESFPNYFYADKLTPPLDKYSDIEPTLRTTFEECSEDKKHPTVFLHKHGGCGNFITGLAYFLIGGGFPWLFLPCSPHN